MDDVKPEFEATRFKPYDYIDARLGWKPWKGRQGKAGQVEILEAYRLALLQQHERQEYEAGRVDEADLQHWKPNQVIQNWIRVESGSNQGKTKLGSAIVSHFYDHFNPSITYTFAPKWEQIEDLLWKYIKVDRGRANLPGRVLDTCQIKDPANADHFAKGKSTDNKGGKGREGIQGQHDKHLLFILDEAEGIADYVYDALNNLTSGGISIVILFANPAFRSSRFYKIQSRENVITFRLNGLYHPNVLSGQEQIPGAATRTWVEMMVGEHASQVQSHNADLFTFELPWKEGTIYLPDAEFCRDVLGVAPAALTDKNLIPYGRYEAATKREPISDNPTVARLGLDCARWGRDNGQGYTRHNGAAYRFAQFIKQDSIEYYQATKREAKRLASLGVTSLHIRVDAGGGFGSGVVDLLKIDDELIKLFADYQVIEANFGGTPKEPTAYYDSITEWTADVAETLKTLAIINPPSNLESDLCEREVEPRNKEGRFVRKLEDKDKFRKRLHRSPDDGDGFTLAVAGDWLFQQQGWSDWA